MTGSRSLRQHGESPTLTIILPAYNEEHRIGPTLRDYLAYFEASSTEVIVVLNGCTDRTSSVVADVQKKMQRRIVVIDIREPIGKGGAIRRGFLAAHGKLVGFVDADGATTAEEFDRLLLAMGEADGVIASRWMRGARVYNRTSWIRKITSLGFIAIAKIMFHLPYRDTQCGAKIFKKKVITAVTQELMTKDMAFDVELLVRVRQHGFYIREVPTIWTDQSSSTVPSSPLKLAKMSFRIFKSLLKLAQLIRQPKPQT